MAYSLKAACSHCNSYGTVDDSTLKCFRCGGIHEITNDERNARDAEMREVAVLTQAGGFDNRKPPKITTATGYARDPDDDSDADETDSWGALGLEDPFGSEDHIVRGEN